MSRSQLDYLYQKIGATNPNVERNGRLLHIRLPLGGFNEWTVLTYNLQIIAQYITENTELRKKYQRLLDTYNNQLAILNGYGKLNPPSPACHPTAVPPAVNPMFLMLSQRIDEMDKRFDKLEEAIKYRL